MALSMLKTLIAGFLKKSLFIYVCLVAHIASSTLISEGMIKEWVFLQNCSWHTIVEGKAFLVAS